LPAEHLSVPADGMSSDIHGSAEYGLATTAETRIDARLSASPTTMDTRRRTHGSGCSHQRRHRRKPSPKSSTSSLRRHRRPRSSRSFVVQGLYPVGMCGADFAYLFSKQYAAPGTTFANADHSR